MQKNPVKIETELVSSVQKPLTPLVLYKIGYKAYTNRSKLRLLLIHQKWYSDYLLKNLRIGFLEFLPRLPGGRKNKQSFEKMLKKYTQELVLLG